MTTQNPYRARATRTDHYQRKYEREHLDSYAAAMQFDPVKTPEEIILEQEAYTRLIQRIDALPPRIGLCIKLRQGIGCEPHTLQQVADRYGLSRGRIQQIEAKGYRILKRRIWIEESPPRWRKERDNVRKAEREREEHELNRRNQQAWQETKDAANAESVKARQQANYEAYLQALAERERLAFANAYDEAHAINALWPSELERRAQEERKRLANQKRREEFEVRLRKYVDKRNAWFDGPIKRDWLLVATEGAS